MAYVIDRSSRRPTATEPEPTKRPDRLQPITTDMFDYMRRGKRIGTLTRCDNLRWTGWHWIRAIQTASYRRLEDAADALATLDTISIKPNKERNA